MQFGETALCNTSDPILLTIMPLLEIFEALSPLTTHLLKIRC